MKQWLNMIWPIVNTFLITKLSLHWNFQIFLSFCRAQFMNSLNFGITSSASQPPPKIKCRIQLCILNEQWKIQTNTIIYARIYMNERQVQSRISVRTQPPFFQPKLYHLYSNQTILINILNTVVLLPLPSAALLTCNNVWAMICYTIQCCGLYAEWVVCHFPQKNNHATCLSISTHSFPTSPLSFWHFARI